MRTFVLTAVLLLAACGGSEEPVRVRLDELVPAFVQAHCANLERCCTPGQPGAPPPDCVDLLGRLWEEEADFIDVRAAVAAGVTEFDEEAAGRCLEHVRALTCAGVSAFIDEMQAGTGLDCLAMLHGTVAEGGACTEHYHCASGVCDLSVCAAAIPAGAACSDSCEDRFECRRCAGSMLCDQVTETCQEDPVIQPASFCTP